MNEETNQETEQPAEENADLLTQEEEASGEESTGEEASGEDGEAGFAESVDTESTGEDSPESDGEGAGDEDANIKLIMDLPLQVVVELGRTKMLINDLLQIGQGSVIELSKQVGEALDVLVNGKLVARGEVVVVKDKFGVRITEVLSTIERIKQLA